MIGIKGAIKSGVVAFSGTPNYSVKLFEENERGKLISLSVQTTDITGSLYVDIVIDSQSTSLPVLSSEPMRLDVAFDSHLSIYVRTSINNTLSGNLTWIAVCNKIISNFVPPDLVPTQISYMPKATPLAIAKNGRVNFAFAYDPANSKVYIGPWRGGSSPNTILTYDLTTKNWTNFPFSDIVFDAPSSAGAYLDQKFYCFGAFSQPHYRFSVYNLDNNVRNSLAGLTTRTPGGLQGNLVDDFSAVGAKILFDILPIANPRSCYLKMVASSSSITAYIYDEDGITLVGTSVLAKTGSSYSGSIVFSSESLWSGYSANIQVINADNIVENHTVDKYLYNTGIVSQSAQTMALRFLGQAGNMIDKFAEAGARTLFDIPNYLMLCYLKMIAGPTNITAYVYGSDGGTLLGTGVLTKDGSLYSGYVVFIDGGVEYTANVQVINADNIADNDIVDMYQYAPEDVCGTTGTQIAPHALVANNFIYMLASNMSFPNAWGIVAYDIINDRFVFPMPHNALRPWPGMEPIPLMDPSGPWRNDHAGVSPQHILGSCSDNSVFYVVSRTDISKFDLATLSISILPNSRYEYGYGTVVAKKENKLYILGGYHLNTGYFSRMLEYDLSTQTLTDISSRYVQLPICSSGVAIIANNNMLVFGGIGDGIMDTVWEVPLPTA